MQHSPPISSTGLLVDAFIFVIKVTLIRVDSRYFMEDFITKRNQVSRSTSKMLIQAISV